MTDLTRLTELGVELPKTWKVRGYDTDYRHEVYGSNVEAAIDELLSLLVAEHEARVRAEDARCLAVMETKDTLSELQQAEADSKRLFNELQRCRELLKHAEAEAALLRDKLEYVGATTVGAWAAMRVFDDLRERAGGGKP